MRVQNLPELDDANLYMFLLIRCGIAPSLKIISLALVEGFFWSFQNRRKEGRKEGSLLFVFPGAIVEFLCSQRCGNIAFTPPDQGSVLHLMLKRDQF